jgi:transcriptional regulator with XRE-family HTH domain
VTTITWPSYLSAITDGAAGARIAERTGIPESTISRWFSEKAEPRPKQVVIVARAYGANPVDGLIAAGYLDENELEVPQTRRLQLRDFTDIELAEETLRRIREGNAPVLEAPLDENHPAMNGNSGEQ